MTAGEKGATKHADVDLRCHRCREPITAADYDQGIVLHPGCDDPVYRESLGLGLRLLGPKWGRA